MSVHLASRWWRLAWVMGCLAVCVGCSERQLAPAANFDPDQAETLRESFDNFYRPAD